MNKYSYLLLGNQEIFQSPAHVIVMDDRLYYKAKFKQNLWAYSCLLSWFENNPPQWGGKQLVRDLARGSVLVRFQMNHSAFQLMLWKRSHRSLNQFWIYTPFLHATGFRMMGNIVLISILWAYYIAPRRGLLANINVPVFSVFYSVCVCARTCLCVCMCSTLGFPDFAALRGVLATI